MKRINKTSVIAILLIGILAVSSIISFAAPSFTDVPEDHWAYEYVEKMKDKGIVSGYFDATFRPSQNVTKVETLIMIYNMLDKLDKIDTSGIDDLVAYYKDTLTENNIPDWANKQIAYALYRDIVKEDELRSFVDDSNHSNADRAEVATFLGRTLNKYLKTDLDNKILLLGFNDENEIPDDARKYVYLLKAEGIVQGDSINKFNPNDPIVRAAAATMLSKTYDYLLDLNQDQDNSSDNEIEEDEDIDNDIANTDIDDDWSEYADLRYREVTIKYIIQNTESILAEDNYENQTLYKFSNAKIVINGIIADFEDLEINDKVRLYFDDDDDLVRVVKSDNSNIIEGEVDEVVSIADNYLISIYRNSDGIRKTYGIEDGVNIVLDGNRGDIDDIESGDSVILEISEQKVEKIIAESTRRTYDGVLMTNPTLDDYYKIKFETFDGKIYEFELHEDADIEKNGKDTHIRNLFAGDIVTVTTRQKKVIKIDSISVEDEVEGTIVSISIGSETKITIEDDDGIERTYTVSSNVDIEIDDDDASLYDLKLNYYVELELEGNLVTKIEAEEVESGDKITGKITKIYKDEEAIRIRVGTGDDAKYYIVKADDATIIDEDLDTTRFSSLEEDFEVLVYGSESNGIFDLIADRILIIRIK